MSQQLQARQRSTRWATPSSQIKLKRRTYHAPLRRSSCLCKLNNDSLRRAYFYAYRKPEEAASGDVLEEFSGLKKKKKSKKSAFDLEAWVYAVIPEIQPGLIVAIHAQL